MEYRNATMDFEIFVIMQDGFFQALSNAITNNGSEQICDFSEISVCQLKRRLDNEISELKIILFGDEFKEVERGVVYEYFDQVSFQGFTPRIKEHMVSEFTELSHRLDRFTDQFWRTNSELYSRCKNPELMDYNKYMMRDQFEAYMVTRDQLFKALNNAMTENENTRAFYGDKSASLTQDSMMNNSKFTRNFF